MHPNLTQEQYEEMKKAMEILKGLGIIGHYNIDNGEVEILDPEKLQTRMVANAKEGIALAFPNVLVTHEMSDLYLNTLTAFFMDLSGDSDVKHGLTLALVNLEIDKAKNYQSLLVTAPELFKKFQLIPLQ